MKNKFIILISYILIFFNSNLHSDENKNVLKVGLLAPLSGEYKDLGQSLLYSLQLALDEIGDKDVHIIPRDIGDADEKKLNDVVQEIRSLGANVIIGPINHEDFDKLKNYNDIVFISPSNINPEFQNNIISIGISLESQMMSLIQFIKKQKKDKTLILIPKNQYTSFIENKLNKMNLKNFKIFKYNPNPKVLTGEIEILTNYSQRKKNLELRKKIYEDKEDEQSLRELKKLEQKYTLGDVNFDSLIIIDFGNSLKSVLASLIFTDVDQNKVLFTTINQWFDESIFYENSIENLYYPSVNYKEFKNYKDSYFKKFKNYPSEITILTYDAIGLIYYFWKKNEKAPSLNDFSFKGSIKGKIGEFSFDNKKVIQDLNIYKVGKDQFIKF
jgi:hypothetical protein